MSGRPRVPGERFNRGILNPEEVRNRTIRGIIDSVDAHNGFVTLNFDGFPSNGRYTSVPWLWASFPEAGKAAWARYMPFQNDTLKIAFDYDETPHAVGYETRAGMAGVADGRAGYPAITKAAESEYILQFTELKSGEYDFMSVGGAYIFGSEVGELLLAGGPVSIDLVKAEDRLYGQAGSYYLRNGTAFIRFGQVKRFNAAQFGDSATGPWNPTLNGREFEVDVRYNDGTLDHRIARFGLGNLATDIGIETATTGLAKIAALDLYDTAGLAKIVSFEIDSEGSIALSSVTGTKASISLPVADVSLNTKSLDCVTVADWTNTVGGKFALASTGVMELTSLDALNITVAGDIEASALGNVTITSSKSLDLIAAVDITLTATAVSIPCPVSLGPSPTGFAFNGTSFSAAMQSALTALQGVLSTANAATIAAGPAQNSAINPMISGLQAFFTTFASAITSSISSQVQVA